MDEYHVPVLLEESIEGLNIKPGGTYVDVTYGGGGHSARILEKLGDGKLIAFDQDIDAIENLPDDNRLTFVNHNFKYIRHFLRYYEIDKVDGILADLGVSSHDFDVPDRGFSFRFEGNLDMRMNQSAALDAAKVVNEYDEAQLWTIFQEMQFVPQLARALVERLALNPISPADPDLLPGTADVASGEPAEGEADGESYLWDAALRRGLSLRNYGCFGDLTRSSVPATYPIFIPLERHPFATNVRQFYPAKDALQTRSDLYYRGFDNKYPDYWRFKEWEREFDQFVANGNLPSLELVRFPHDHFGSFADAIDGVNTPERQMADNDYALGQLVQKVAGSPYRDDTLVFVVEDDAQDGPDHVSAHRSVAFVLGPYVKQGAVVSAPYNTVSMVKTIEEVLGLEPLGLNDALAAPMSEVFDPSLSPSMFAYVAKVPAVLRSTSLPVPAATASNSLARPTSIAMLKYRHHGAAYWEAVMRGQNFDREDALDTSRFNRALWRGMMGSRPYPNERLQDSD